MTTRPLLLSLLFLLSCSGENPNKDQQTETGVPDDTSDSQTLDTVDTGDSGSTEQHDLQIQPATIRVDVGASWSYRVTDKHEGDLDRRDVAAEGFSVQVSDASILSVDTEGKATALAVGETSVEVVHEGVTVTAQVVVQDSSLLEVTVVHGMTGEPIPNARVLHGETKIVVDENGWGTLQLPGPEPTWVTAYAEQGSEFSQATFLDVVAREVTLPLLPVGSRDQGEAEVLGSVDFSETLPGGGGEKPQGTILVGLAVPSLQRGALMLDAKNIFSPNRYFEFLGYAATAPGNLFIEEVVEDWQVYVDEGTVGVWAMAGLMPVAELITVPVGTGSVIDFLLPHLDGFRYVWEGGLEASEAGAVELELKPEHSITDTIEVFLPENPEGFEGTENAFLLALFEEEGGGPIVAGLGQGKVTAFLPRVPASIYGWEGEGKVLAYLEVGGTGVGGARVLAEAWVQEGVATILEWQTAPSVSAFDGATREYSLATDSSAHLVHVHVSSQDGGHRDLYLPSGERTDTLSEEGIAMGFGVTDWALLSVETVTGTYDSLLVDGLVAATAQGTNARTTAMVDSSFGGE